MAYRFRKSIKIAPGLKLNLNKKSVGLTFGGKGLSHTINSKGRKTSTVGVPGTGLSFSSVTNSKTRQPDKKTKKAIMRTRKNVKPSKLVMTTHVTGTAQKYGQVNTTAGTAKTDVARRMEFIDSLFPKDAKKMYYGRFTTLKKFISAACVILGVLLFLYPALILVFIPLLIFRIVWKRKDNGNLRTYKRIRSSFLSGSYERCISKLDTLYNNGIKNDQLEQIKNECILHIFGSSIQKLNDLVSEISAAIWRLERESTIDAVLSNYAVITEKIAEARELENTDIPTDILNSAIIETSRLKHITHYINSTVKRTLQAVIIESSSLKTDRGKINRIKKYFEDLEKHYDHIPLESVTYIRQLMDELL